MRLWHVVGLLAVVLAVKGMNHKAAENLYAAFHDAPHAAPDA